MAIHTSEQRVEIPSACKRAVKASLYNHFVAEGDGDAVLAFNARTLALTRIEKKVAALLSAPGANRACSVEMEDQGVVEHLLEGGFLVHSDLNELEWLQSAFEALHGDQRSAAVTIAPTIWCNLDCIYCFEGPKPRAKMTKETEAKVTRYFDSGLKSLSVAWYGGEPLLVIDTIERLSSEIRSLCLDHQVELRQSIITNGVLLSKEMASRLSRMGVNQVQVTVDGVRETHDRQRPFLGGGRKSSYDLIMKNLEAAAGVIPIAVRINVMRDNADSVLDLVRKFRDLGMLGRGKGFQFYFAQVKDSATHSGSPGCKDTTGTCLDRKEFSQLEASLNAQLIREGVAVRKFATLALSGCGTVSPTGVVIGPHGELYKCWESVGREDQIVGSVTDNPAEDMGQSSLMRYWASWNPFQDSDCVDCRVLPLCMGGCPAHALKHGRSAGVNCTSWKFSLEQGITNYLDALGTSDTGAIESPKK